MTTRSTSSTKKIILEDNNKYHKVFNGHPPMFLMIDVKNIRKTISK